MVMTIKSHEKDSDPESSKPSKQLMKAADKPELLKYHIIFDRVQGTEDEVIFLVGKQDGSLMSPRETKEAAILMRHVAKTILDQKLMKKAKVIF